MSMQFRSRCLVGALAVLTSIAAATPAVAAPVGFSVAITAHTNFDAVASDFHSNLPGCATGTVVDSGASPHFTPWGGSFVGAKVFTCAGGESGFTIRLRARFGGGGSTGTWTLASATGDLAGLKGSGSLVGIPSDIGIDDVYTGTVR